MAANLTATTSSFVAEVLATAGRVEKEDIIAKIVKLSKHVDELKVEVHDTLQKNYVEFYPSLSMALELRTRVEKTLEEMELVADRVEKEIKSQLNVSAAEFQDLSSQLNVANQTLAILDHLVKMNDLLQAVKSSLGGKDYRTAAESVEALEALLSQVQGDLPENAIEVLTAIKDTCVIQKRKLVSDLSEMWSEDVRWTLPKDTDQKTTVKVELTIASDNEVKKHLCQAFEPMWKLGVLPDKLRVFGKRFLRHMVTSIIGGGRVVVKANSGNDQKPSVAITVMTPDKDMPDVTLLSVLSGLTGVFAAINEHLLGLELPNDDGSGTVPLMRKLGEIISSDCLDLIIQNCLSKTIPSSARELDSYSDTVVQTETFRDNLVGLQFISADDTTLMDYVNNVNVLFASKQCQDAFETARSLLTSDIHSMVLIRHDDPLGDVNAKGFGRIGSKKSLKTNEKDPLSCSAKLSANTFKMPTCNISVSTQKLLQLAYSMLHEASTGTEFSAYQIFYTVRSVFELFCIVVPTFHKRELQNLPQVAALHHNNCLYLAHHLLTLGHQFQSQLPKPLTNVSVSFVDLVPKLRRLGTECFIRCLRKQRDELIGCLKNARGFNGVADDDTFDDAQRAINQLLHELQHLGRVWTVLPPSVYYKSMGTLLNSAVVDMMSYITTLEDISADDASLLHTLLASVVERAPDCLQPPVGDPEAKPELFKHVAKWLKFKELMLVLNAGLHDIADRWADGKGPLAQEFTGSEVKQLVRALFQNTERRAAVLAKIR